jgi:hypothetical protein
MTTTTLTMTRAATVRMSMDGAVVAMTTMMMMTTTALRRRTRCPHY